MQQIYSAARFCYVATMRFHKAIVILLLGLTIGLSFAVICATCNALPNARLSLSGAAGVAQSEQRLAAIASNCEFQGVCAIAGLSIATPDEMEMTVSRAGAPSRHAPHLPSSRTIKPPLHPPKFSA